VHKNNLNLTVANLVCDDNFVEHQLYPTEQSTLFWKEWLVKNPIHHNEWQQAQKLLDEVRLGLSDYARTYLSEEAEEQLLTRIKDTITQHKYEKAIIPLWKKTWAIAAVAACLLVFFGIVFWNISGKNTSLYQQQIADLGTKPIEKINNSSSPLLITLPDGSTVLIFPKSRISYTHDFGKNNRKVFLIGEATFEVVKNPLNPFYVYANELVTKVLGTKFTVKSFEDKKEVIVTVEQGQVSVYQNEKAEKQDLKGVLLTPNQKVVFTRQTAQFIKSIVSEPNIIPTEEKISFIFDETPIQEVFERVEKAYEINIIFNKETLKKCQLTASFNDESLFQKLDIITQSIGSTYEIIDGEVIIMSRGCK